MINMDKDRKVMELCSIADFKEALDTILDQLERCQKALNDFIEEKRNKCLWFYFIADDDLLTKPISDLTTSEEAIIEIYTVTLNELPPMIIEMNSTLNEKVKLVKAIEVD